MSKVVEVRESSAITLIRSHQSLAAKLSHRHLSLHRLVSVGSRQWHEIDDGRWWKAMTKTQSTVTKEKENGQISRCHTAQQSLKQCLCLLSHKPVTHRQQLNIGMDRKFSVRTAHTFIEQLFALVIIHNAFNFFIFKWLKTMTRKIYRTTLE